jgi:hypothetical protein
MATKSFFEVKCIDTQTWCGVNEFGLSIPSNHEVVSIGTIKA